MLQSSNFVAHQTHQHLSATSAENVKEICNKREQLELHSVEKTQRSFANTPIKNPLKEFKENNKPSEELLKRRQEALATLNEKTWEMQRYLLRAGTYPLPSDKSIIDIWV